MPKTLIADTIKNVYQKLVFFLTSDNKLYKTTEDSNNDDTVITTIANNLTLSGSNTFSGTSTFNGSIAGTSVKDEDNMASNSATAIATQQSIKAYVDAQDLDISGDSGTASIINSETLQFLGGTGLDSAIGDNRVTYAIDSTVTTLDGTQALTNKTLASALLTTPSMTSPSINTGDLTFKAEDIGIVFEGDNDNAYETKLLAAGPAGADRIVWLPDADDILVGKATADLLSNKTLASAVLNTAVTGTAIKDEDNMASDSATHIATQQSIKAYVDDHISTGAEVTLGGATNAVTITGENGKWALVHMCSDDSTQAMLVHINFVSGTSTHNILTSTSMAYDSRTGVTATFSGLTAGHKIRWERIAGDSTISIAAATI